METQELVSPSTDAPEQRSVLVQDILTKDNLITLEYLPYSPNLAAANFYVAPRLKSALKGQHFRDDTDVRNGTEELKRLS